MDRDHGLEDYSTASDAKDFDVNANRFIAGLYEVLIERLATNNALQEATPASQAVVDKIDASRKSIKEEFDTGLSEIQRRVFPKKEFLLLELKEALQKANDFRRQADAAIKLPRDQRDGSLVKAFIPGVTNSVNAALRVWFSALYSTAKNDPGSRA